MSKKTVLLFSLLLPLLILSRAGLAQTGTLLTPCWKKYVEPFETTWLHLVYTDTRQHLYHSFEPWQTYKRTTQSAGWFSPQGFVISDTLHSQSGKTFTAKTVFDSTSLLTIDFGDTEIAPVIKSDWYDALITSAAYTPMPLIDYFYRHHSEAILKTDSGREVYSLTINKTIVRLALFPDTAVDCIETIEKDDLRGDAKTLYRYNGNNDKRVTIFPGDVTITKFEGKVNGTVTIPVAETVNEIPLLIAQPPTFTFKEEKEKTPDVSVETFSDHIHFINLKHTEARSIVVEFSSFLAVIGAPLSSANGELIIQEAKKIAPNKPIKYFAFGHHHPWYVGGLRPFVYRGATVLTTTADIPYLSFLATAPHKLDPDSLFLHPHELQTQEVHDSTLITDGSYEMKVYWIGKQSHHTDDYMVFYFPQEQLLEEDDLGWIKEDGTVTKASERQAGLVNAVRGIGIVPKTVVQSWPLSGYGVKTVFPYSDFEASMKGLSENGK